MLVVQIAILAIMLIGIPTIVGSLFANVDRGANNFGFMWISGQMLIWAGFQLICAPMILLKKRFMTVQDYFNIYTVILVLFALLLCFLRRRKGNWVQRLKTVPKEEKKSYYILWCAVVVLLLFQLVMACCMAYEEGDDAFYVAISTITVDSHDMYNKLPYTGGTTGLDARHGLAPFPIWISYLAKLSGMPAVTVAQIALPVVLIVMAYTVYYLIGKRLLAKHRNMLPLFMIFVELLVLFGGYSIYSTENFMLVRTAQGKAVLANIIIPVLFLLLFILLEKLQKEEKLKWQYWMLMLFVMISGCLCSTQGALLTCMLIGIVGVCAAVCYRRWRILLPMGASCVIPVGFALMYLMLG